MQRASDTRRMNHTFTPTCSLSRLVFALRESIPCSLDLESSKASQHVKKTSTFKGFTGLQVLITYDRAITPHETTCRICRPQTPFREPCPRIFILCRPMSKPSFIAGPSPAQPAGNETLDAAAHPCSTPLVNVAFANRMAAGRNIRNRVSLPDSWNWRMSNALPCAT